MRLLPFIAAALGSAALACAPGNVCGEDTQTLPERCVTSEDCTRPAAEVGVCFFDTGNERACVRCAPAAAGEAPSQCILITPVSCS